MCRARGVFASGLPEELEEAYARLERRWVRDEPMRTDAIAALVRRVEARLLEAASENQRQISGARSSSGLP